MSTRAVDFTIDIRGRRQLDVWMFAFSADFRTGRRNLLLFKVFCQGQLVTSLAGVWRFMFFNDSMRLHRQRTFHWGFTSVCALWADQHRCIFINIFLNYILWAIRKTHSYHYLWRILGKIWRIIPFIFPVVFYLWLKNTFLAHVFHTFLRSILIAIGIDQD